MSLLSGFELRCRKLTELSLYSNLQIKPSLIYWMFIYLLLNIILHLIWYQHLYYVCNITRLILNLTSSIRWNPKQWLMTKEIRARNQHFIQVFKSISKTCVHLFLLIFHHRQTSIFNLQLLCIACYYLSFLPVSLTILIIL